MRSVSSSRSSTFALYMVMGLVLVVVVVASSVSLQDASPMTLAVIRSFAGETTLTTLAEITMSEAIKEGGSTAAVGFLLTFVLTLVWMTPIGTDRRSFLLIQGGMIPDDSQC